MTLKLFSNLMPTVAGVLLALCGCGESTPTGKAPQHPDGHARMLALLQQIKEQTPNEHFFLGDAALRRAENQLSMLPPNVADATRCRLIAMIGAHELRLGRTEKAIEHVLEAYRLLPKTRGQISTEMTEAIIQTLAVAYLRLGETQNCVHHHTSESCILPIRKGGIHTNQTGSRQAITYFKILLKRNPSNLTARWLLNVAYMTVGEYPDAVPPPFLIPPEAFESEEEFPRFVNIAPELGLNAFSLSGGVIVDDFDNDGLLDIMTSTWNTSGQIRYYRNNGDGSFTERTEAAGLTGLYGGLNLKQADYDNDGDIDVLVLRGAWLEMPGSHPNSLLRNDGKGRFRDVTFEAGLGEKHFPTQTAAWSDYDNDGDLDLYIGNENAPCQLFENDGNGKFVDVARKAGVENGRFTKGVVWGDYDGDRLPDLYVSNLDGPNRLYHNNGNGTFTDLAEKLGVDRPLHSFPVWFWDFNNDGALDLFVASYTATAHHIAADYLGLPHDAEPDCLYQGDGKGGFREVAVEQNLTRVTQPMGCNFGDVDNDGFPDFYLGTGDTAYEALVPNLMFRNKGGIGFSDVTTAGGLGHLQKGHGVAFADLDNDGDQDIFIELGGAFPGDAFGNALFENPGFGNHSITITLIGKTSNRSAIGARIRAEFQDSGSKRSVYKWVNSGASFGGNPLRQKIGLGHATRIEVLEVFWPKTGRTQRFHDVLADQFIEITEGADEFRKLPLQAMKFRSLGMP